MNLGERLLITGGSGFLGTNLVEYFANHGWKICNFDILPPRNNQHASYWKHVDIRDRDSLIDEVRKFNPTVILHCAARTDLEEKLNLDGYSANIDGICYLIEAIRSVKTIKRVIFFSSQLVCRLGYKPNSYDDYQPSTLYGRSKVLGEKIVKAAAEFGPIWMIVRPTSLWGPWFDVPYRSFFISIKQGQYLHPSGIHTYKQWGFIGNSVYQIRHLLEAPKQAVHAKIFYLSDYEPVELRIFADKVQTAFQVSPIRSVSLGVLKIIAKAGDLLGFLGWRNPPLTSFRLGNILTNEVQNLEPLQKIVGPLPFTISEGIDITVQWLNENRNKSRSIS